jgi:hypothetical protein
LFLFFSCFSARKSDVFERRYQNRKTKKEYIDKSKYSLKTANWQVKRAILAEK